MSIFKKKSVFGKDSNLDTSNPANRAQASAQQSSKAKAKEYNNLSKKMESVQAKDKAVNPGKYTGFNADRSFYDTDEEAKAKRESNKAAFKENDGYIGAIRDAVNGAKEFKDSPKVNLSRVANPSEEIKQESKRIQQPNQASQASQTSQTSQTNQVQQDSGNYTQFQETPDVEYDKELTETAKRRGLDKYIKEDGSIDYKKLKKGTIGLRILQALAGAGAGFGAGLAGQQFNADNMKNGILAKEIESRNEVVSQADELGRNKLDDSRDIDTLTKKLNLTGEQQTRVHDKLLSLNRKDRQAILDKINKLPKGDQLTAIKILAGNQQNWQESLANAGLNIFDSIFGGGK